jgi:putative ABC transport system substrate-binding protein
LGWAAIYSNRVNVTESGLMCYALERVDQFTRAAGYIDRILKGEKAADLPVHSRPSTSW